MSCMTSLLSIQLLLIRENSLKHERELHDDNAFIERIGVDGEKVKAKVDKVCGVLSSNAEYWGDRNF